MTNMKKGKVKKEGFYCSCCGATWDLGPEDMGARTVYRFYADNERTRLFMKDGLASYTCRFCQRSCNDGTPNHEQLFFISGTYSAILEALMEHQAHLEQLLQEGERRRQERKAKRSK